MLFAEVRLDEDEIRKLHDFEEDCMDDLSRKKLISEALNSETRLQNTAERYAVNRFMFSNFLIWLRESGKTQGWLAIWKVHLK